MRTGEAARWAGSVLCAVGLLVGAATAEETLLAPAASPAVCEAPSRAPLDLGPGVAPAVVTDFERGAAQMSHGAFAEARSAYLAAAESAASAELPTLAARARANAARAALDAGALDGLAAELAALREEVERFGDPAERAVLLVNVARSDLRLAEARPGLASVLRLRAVHALARAEAAAAEAGDARTRSFALGFLGEVYEQAGRYEESLTATRRALFKAQESDSPDALYRWQWQQGRIERATGSPAQALASLRAAVRTLAALRGQVALGSADTQANFRRQVAPLYLELVDLLLSGVEGEGASDAGQALLREARNALEDYKAAELRDYFRDECLDAERKASPDEIPGALVVYPIILPDRLELIASESGRLSRHTSPVDEATFRGEVHALRQTLVKRTTYQYLRHARQLYDRIIRPLESRLAEDRIETIVWVPGGVLRTVPIGALRDRETETFLIERYPIAVTPGLTLTSPRAIDRQQVRLLAAGISEAIMGYPALPAVPEELAAIAALFPSDSLVNEEFTVEAFAREMSAAPYAVVHIASHGEFAADNSESYLLAYGERFSMDRMASLVSATRFGGQPLELLTLSACKTAAGDERAALGLAGVALQAGARSALATLWSVDDAAAATLVTEFYAQLANPELSRAQALQRAQLSVMRRFRYRHAAYWAPFLLISSWL